MTGFDPRADENSYGRNFRNRNSDFEVPTGFKDPWNVGDGYKGISQHEPGAKLDGDKPDLSLLLDFGDALYEVARVGTYGMVKYTRGGWLKVPNGIVRYTAALFRHLFSKDTYDTDPWYDTPEGLPFKGKVRHDAQVAWNALARLQRSLIEEKCQ